MSVASNMKNAAAKLLAASMAAVLALGIANVNKYSDSFSLFPLKRMKSCPFKMPSAMNIA